jgi:hypothetical protein
MGWSPLAEDASSAGVAFDDIALDHLSDRSE